MSENRTFASFSFPEPLSKAIKSMGFTEPTPVQTQAIPVALEGRDVVALAETGSGKTLAYLIPTLLRTRNQQALILSPTRELAMQTIEVIGQLTQYSRHISSVLLIGGAPMERQMRNLKRSPRFIVATPGRLMDHYRRRTVDLKNIDTLILDEADRMFDMGFAPQVKEIVKHVPTQRQTMLFSATFPKEIRELANKILVNPLDISIQKQTLPPAKINQKVIEIAQNMKDDKTLDLIGAATGSVLVFARTKHRTDRLATYLEEYGVSVARLHGNRSQGQRNKAIQGFKSGEFRVLVATDIAARGIDVSSISDVINYDLPECFEDYVHRIGRTGRAGREGQALTFVTQHDRQKWSAIARKIGLAVPALATSPRNDNNRFKSNRKDDRRGSGSNNKGSSKPHWRRAQKSSSRPSL